ncbi:hypothetical protein RYZ26_10225 [Terasakiella sp. A23]|uniref:hypothetical protein n=1 Tax=Terasakiella sp. FCG-A23 TaxID=3080561 RepID=UPI0029543D1E|nr:hypothetical protein [Terasakiella sp. A23]MDV7339971.1 hypothetical protein [Terasakiella sp. A23]
MIKRGLLSFGFILALTACGEPAPAGWNANIDIDCKPHDPYDKLYAMISPKKFWREQEYDIGSLKAAGTKNLELSKSVLQDSLAQKGEYFQRADKAARDLGLTGKAKRDHVKDNMDRYDKEVKAIEERLKMQETAITWIKKCEPKVQQELRKLKLAPVEYDPEKRPM